jgi:hypothetical protein
MRSLLLAELEVRLQPVMGLIEALAETIDETTTPNSTPNSIALPLKKADRI